MPAKYFPEIRKALETEKKQDPDPDPHEDFCLDPDPQKNADPKPWLQGTQTS